MQWATLLAVIIEFLGPILRDWLANLLKRATEQLDAGNEASPAKYVGDGAAAESLLWSRAESLLDKEAASLAWYQWIAQWRHAARKRYFEAARASALRRAGEFYDRAVLGTPVTSLSSFEIEWIESVE